MCPYSHISGGLSNLSFSFRGLNDLREAMHSVFLYYAISQGMDMGIVNAGKLPLYAEIDPVLSKLLTEIIMNESEKGDHVERLIEYAKLEKERIDSDKEGGIKKPK